VSDAAHLVALVELPGMGPARLRRLLEHRTAVEAWEAVRAGAVPEAGEVGRVWARHAAGVEPAERLASHVAAGIEVVVSGDAAWPAALLDDPEPPMVLFARGDPSVVDRPCVALVGTRRCTATGREVARELGEELADAGVCVLSGLAMGIDGAAHEGALRAGGPLAGVVGSGLDVVYPRSHRDLWESVATRGLLVSEYPLGTWPDRWHFPARNRILAGLADVVVVVESRAAGGSMHTVESAIERGRTVMAVPGSVRNPAAAGTNALLAAGAIPARDAGDVLVALGLDTIASRARHGSPAPQPADPEQVAVLEAFGGDALTLEQLADRLGSPLGPVAVHLVALEREGWVHSRAGWYERLR
jgi:DNA processing protein